MITIFAGPSLPTRHRPSDPDLEWRPPATAGDLLAMLDRPPHRLCLIDGYFDSCPAPWHKELMLLMEKGNIVFGAASMGALRAAELDRFGMIGVGAVYRAYRDGRLSGDDEVALIHATDRLDFAPLTVPMVEVRATLVAARRAGAIDRDTARTLRARIHDMHFSDRDWPAIESACAGLADKNFLRGLKHRHVPLKRIDALTCIAAARGRIETTAARFATPITCFVEALAAAPQPPAI